MDTSTPQRSPPLSRTTYKYDFPCTNNNISTTSEVAPIDQHKNGENELLVPPLNTTSNRIGAGTLALLRDWLTNPYLIPESIPARRRSYPSASEPSYIHRNMVTTRARGATAAHTATSVRVSQQKMMQWGQEMNQRMKGMQSQGHIATAREVEAPEHGNKWDGVGPHEEINEEVVDDGDQAIDGFEERINLYEDDRQTIREIPSPAGQLIAELQKATAEVEALKIQRDRSCFAKISDSLVGLSCWQCAAVIALAASIIWWFISAQGKGNTTHHHDRIAHPTLQTLRLHSALKQTCNVAGPVLSPSSWITNQVSPLELLQPVANKLNTGPTIITFGDICDDVGILEAVPVPTDVAAMNILPAFDFAASQMLLASFQLERAADDCDEWKKLAQNRLPVGGVGVEGVHREPEKPLPRHGLWEPPAEAISNQAKILRRTAKAIEDLRQVVVEVAFKSKRQG